MFGPWTYLNLNHLNSNRFTTIRERNPLVKRDPIVLGSCSCVD